MVQIWAGHSITVPTVREMGYVPLSFNVTGLQCKRVCVWSSHVLSVCVPITGHLQGVR